MPAYEEIMQQIQRVNSTILKESRVQGEMKYLQQCIGDNEVINKIETGSKHGEQTTGILVATNQRLLFLRGVFGIRVTISPTIRLLQLNIK